MDEEATTPLDSEGGQWMLLVDPAWSGVDDDEQPPVDAIVGGWFVGEDGTTGSFEPNPMYLPAELDSPTDTADALVGLAVEGKIPAEHLVPVLHRSVLGVAVDEESNPEIVTGPDGVNSVVVTTAPAHRHRVDAHGWEEVFGAELAEALPDEGIDVLINPGARAYIRLQANVFKAQEG